MLLTWPIAALVPDELLGPNALLVAAIALVIFLGRKHFQQDALTLAERDEWRKLYLAGRHEFDKLAKADESALGIEPL